MSDRHTKALLGQGLRFGAVGLAATLLHVVLVLALVEGPDLPVLLANGLAFCAALALSYLGNHGWTFRANGGHQRHAPRFLAVALAGLVLNQAIMAASVDGFGLDYRLGLALVVTLVPLLSFLANRTWVFQGPTEPEEHGAR